MNLLVAAVQAGQVTGIAGHRGAHLLATAGYVAFSEAIARRWLLGQASRKDAQRALTDTLLRLLLETIPGR